jgi:hypothetical protein
LKTRTLEERCYERRIKRPGWTDAEGHVRAELDRLAVQVRKSMRDIEKNNAIFKASSDPRDLLLSERCEGGINSLTDVLALIKEARK